MAWRPYCKYTFQGTGCWLQGKGFCWVFLVWWGFFVCDFFLIFCLKSEY